MPSLAVCRTFSTPGSLVYHSPTFSLSESGTITHDGKEFPCLDSDPDEEPPEGAFVACLKLDNTHYVCLTAGGSIMSVSVRPSVSISAMGSIPCGILASVSSANSEIVVILTAEGRLLGLTRPVLDDDGDHVGMDSVFETGVAGFDAGNVHKLISSKTPSVLLLTTPTNSASTSPSATTGTYYDLTTGLPTHAVHSRTSADNRTFAVTNEDKTPTLVATHIIPNLSPAVPIGDICTGSVMHANMFLSVTHSPSTKGSTTPYSLVTVEPNGLLHHSFPIPPTSYTGNITALSMSSTGEFVLLASGSETTTRVTVLYRDNYKYRNILTRVYPGSPITASFHAPATTGLFESVEYSVITSESSSYVTLRRVGSMFNETTQWYVDVDYGVKVREYGKRLTPPPMVDLHVDQVEGVACFDYDKQYFCDKEGTLFKLNGEEGADKIAEGIGRQWDQFCVCADESRNEIDIVYYKDDSLHRFAISTGNTAVVVDNVPEVTCLQSVDGVAYWATNDAIMSLSSDNIITHVRDVYDLYKDFVVVSSTGQDAEPSSAPENVIVGVTDQGRLYVNDTLVCPSIASMVVSDRHGIVGYTTTGSKPMLVFKHLAKFGDFRDVDEDVEEQAANSNMSRNVEYGASVQCILSNSPTVVLRMPRGNLEGIYPRLLVLKHVRRLIKEREWQRAYNCCRRMRIDFNFIVDYDYNGFKEDVANFVEQIGGEGIQKVIMMLQNINFCEHKYKDDIGSIEEESEESKSFFADKVNYVCQIIRRTMLSKTNDDADAENDATMNKAYVLPVLSTFAKQNPPDLVAALGLIKKQCKGKLVDSFAQESFKYLAFIAKYETIYSEALGMYDWELARAIARNSQMDPRKYLPEIERYKLMNQDKAKMAIDVMLGRWELAVRHGLDAGEVEECFAIIEREGLIKLALELFTRPEDKTRVWRIMARQMKKEGKSRAAIDAFLSIGEVGEAIDVAKFSGDWGAIFSNWRGLKSDEGELVGLEDVVEEVVDLLETSEDTAKRRNEKYNAARILVEYSPTPQLERAAKILCDANHFVEAARVAQMCNDDERAKVYGDVLEACRNFARTTSTSFQERLEKFESNYSRYAEVKKILAEKAERGEINNGNSFYDGQESEFSAATSFSNASMNSVSSVGSAKSYSSAYSGQSTNFELKRSLGDGTPMGKGNKSQKEMKRIKERERKQRKHETKKIRPGSKEELNYIFSVLKSVLLGKEEVESVGDCISLLTRIGEASTLGLRLFSAHDDFRKSVNGSKDEIDGDVTFECLDEEVVALYSYLRD